MGGFKYGMGAAAENQGSSESGPKVDFDALRGKPFRVQFVKFFRTQDGQHIRLERVPKYPYCHYRKDNYYFNVEGNRDVHLTADQVPAWEHEVTTVWRILAPFDQYGGLLYDSRKAKGIVIESDGMGYDLVLSGMIPGLMTICMAAGLNKTKALAGPFYDENYIHGRVVANCTPPLTFEQVLRLVIEPILLEAVEQKDHMVAGGCKNKQFVKIDLSKYAAMDADQIAQTRAEIKAKGFDVAAAPAETPEDAPAPFPGAGGANAEQPWLAITLGLKDLNEKMAEIYAANKVPVPNVPGGEALDALNRIQAFAKIVKPDLVEGPIFPQLTEVQMKHLYWLLAPPKDAAPKQALSLG